MANNYTSYSDDDGDTTNALRVKLREQGTTSGSTTGRRTVVFASAPDISETRSVNYKTVDPIHGPGSIYAYINTSSRAYNISGIKLISRSREEATRNLARLNLIRSWCMPVFGQYTNADGVSLKPVGVKEDPSPLGFENSNMDILGSPPKILEFSAYSDSMRTGNIHRIPVVISSFSIVYPSDVDYIPTAEVVSIPHIAPGTPFPTMMTIDLQLAETHSPVEYTHFSIADFRNGKLGGY